MLRNDIDALRSIGFEDFLLALVLRKKSSFLEKLRFLKEMQHFHQEEHCKAFQAGRERRKKKEEEEKKENKPDVRVFLAGIRLTVHRQFEVRKLSQLAEIPGGERRSMI